MTDSVTLKEHLSELRRADLEATKTALASAEKAVHIAEVNSQRWRDNANEWRTAMSDRERNFLTRKEFYTMIATAVTVIAFVVGFK